MSSYAITPQPEGSEYNVHIVGSDGVRQTMLGFASEAEAMAWIEGDRARDQAVASE